MLHMFSMICRSEKKTVNVMKELLGESECSSSHFPKTAGVLLWGEFAQNAWMHTAMLPMGMHLQVKS